MHLQAQTIRLLEDIERRIDPTVEEDYARQWEDFLYDRTRQDIFVPTRRQPAPPTEDFPLIHINDTLHDYELMLLSQLRNISYQLSSTNQNLCVRADYGTGIMTSLFGAEIFEMPKEMGLWPTTRALDDTDRIREVLEAGAPDLYNGFGRRVFEFTEYCKEIFENYPKIQKYVDVYHPDTQGPLCICDLLWGGEMFYAMYDEPELVHAMMQLITDTYVRFLDKWFEYYPKDSGMNCHWGGLRHRGTIMLRCDSAVNIAPEFYQEFSQPYDSALLKHYGGGAMHFCGRGDHYIEFLAELPGLSGINVSQAWLNDREKLYRHTVDKGIKLLDYSPEYAAKDCSRPGGFHGNMHAIKLVEAL